MKKWLLISIVIVSAIVFDIYCNPEKIAELEAAFHENNLFLPDQSTILDDNQEAPVSFNISSLLLKLIACSNALSAEECDIDTQYECSIQ